MELLVAFGLISAVTVWAFISTYILYRRTTLAYLKGPESESFFLGHARELLLPECGETEAKWQNAYGAVFRIKGGLGEDRLYVADPKALQHILQKGGYNYLKLPGDYAAKALSGGRGLIMAEGSIHKHYRKVNAGIPEPVAFVPVFFNMANKVINKWKDIVNEPGNLNRSAVIDMNLWMSKAALDVIGMAAMDHDFRYIDGAEDPLRAVHDARSAATFGPLTWDRMLFEALHNEIPLRLLNLIHKWMPSRRFKELRRTTNAMNKLLGEAFQERLKQMSGEKKELWDGKKDLLSILAKTRLSGDMSRYLKDEEIPEQLVSTIFGGHGTIALSMSWAMYEIASRPKLQAKMRAEVLELLAKAHARGNADLSILDLDSLHYTDAVIRECFRHQSITIGFRREASIDDVLPLQIPITTVSGKMINEIHIPKGTRLYVSVHGYHLNEDVWGNDAHEFKPERWYRNKNTTGLFGNALTFSSGVKSCPGRRFSYVEMQAFFVVLLSNFEFSIPENAKRVRRQRGFAMLPLVEGEEELGPKYPVKITPLSI